jgi:hypothetical protein
MTFTQAYNDLKKQVEIKQEQVKNLNKLFEKKNIDFIKLFTNQIKELEISTKNLKLELKNLNIEAKQIEKTLKEGKDVLSVVDFSDIVSISDEKLTFKDLALLLVLEKPVVELKEIIYKKIRSKYLPIESWSDEKIQEVFSNIKDFPKVKDIYLKLPKSYKPKPIPKKREEAIKKIIEIKRKNQAGFIIDKV